MKSLQESILTFFQARPELYGATSSTGRVASTPEKLTADLLTHIKQERTVHTMLKLKKLKVAPGPT